LIEIYTDPQNLSTEEFRKKSSISREKFALLPNLTLPPTKH
jgi:hypothetical protein